MPPPLLQDCNFVLNFASHVEAAAPISSSRHLPSSGLSHDPQRPPATFTIPSRESGQRPSQIASNIKSLAQLNALKQQIDRGSDDEDTVRDAAVTQSSGPRADQKSPPKSKHCLYPVDYECSDHPIQNRRRSPHGRVELSPDPRYPAPLLAIKDPHPVRNKKVANSPDEPRNNHDLDHPDHAVVQELKEHNGHARGRAIGDGYHAQNRQIYNTAKQPANRPRPEGFLQRTINTLHEKPKEATDCEHLARPRVSSDEARAWYGDISQLDFGHDPKLDEQGRGSRGSYRTPFVETRCSSPDSPDNRNWTEQPDIADEDLYSASPRIGAAWGSVADQEVGDGRTAVDVDYPPQRGPSHPAGKRHRSPSRETTGAARGMEAGAAVGTGGAIADPDYQHQREHSDTPIQSHPHSRRQRGGTVHRMEAGPNMHHSRHIAGNAGNPTMPGRSQLPIHPRPDPRQATKGTARNHSAGPEAGAGYMTTGADPVRQGPSHTRLPRYDDDGWAQVEAGDRSYPSSCYLRESIERHLRPSQNTTGAAHGAEADGEAEGARSRRQCSRSPIEQIPDLKKRAAQETHVGPGREEYPDDESNNMSRWNYLQHSIERKLANKPGTREAVPCGTEVGRCLEAGQADGADDRWLNPEIEKYVAPKGPQARRSSS
ncbi:MAG: hypothetical protein Q9201_000863 [Fulgogasparrea decipioides]